MMILTRGMLKIMRVESAGIFSFLLCISILKDFLTWPPFLIDPGDVLRMLHVAPEGEKVGVPVRTTTHIVR